MARARSAGYARPMPPTDAQRELVRRWSDGARIRELAAERQVPAEQLERELVAALEALDAGELQALAET